MKTTKGGKVMNPTDSYRKELRKRELKRNKKERKKVREVGILKKDPDTLKEQIDKLEAMKADGALDKARKHKKRQLEDTLNLVMKKRKEYESKMREKGEEPVMFSHLGPLRRQTTSEEEDRVKHPKPEDSVYYHPTLNPTGAPPPGKPQMYKSSIGPRMPLSGASSSGSVSTSLADMDDINLSVPPPPPPPPLPHAGEVDADGSVITESLPLPPPPPKPPTPSAADLGTNLPPPPMPPPPPGPPPKEQTVNHQLLPPPPPPAVNKSVQPPPPGIGLEREKSQSTTSDNIISQEPVQGSSVLPPPPPPPGMPPKPVVNQSEGASSKFDFTNNNLDTKELSKVLPPPPPLRQQPPIPGPPLHPALQKDVLPPGISHIPPPPPDMRPQLSAPGISSQHVPPGMMVPLMPRPPYGPPPGTPIMMRPPLPPGPPPNTLDGPSARPFVPQKPSYVKSAASTVVKRPLAQHTPQLTSMVPASVRVKRESAIPKPKPKPSLPSATTSTTVPKAPPAVAKQESGRSSSSAVKPQSVDDSYMAFLEDMKALGALDT